MQGYDDAMQRDTERSVCVPIALSPIHTKSKLFTCLSLAYILSSSSLTLIRPLRLLTAFPYTTL